jgi:hypothetical protein
MVGAVLAYGLAAVVAAACIIAPPPDLPTQPVERPTILHDAVVPPADGIMTPAQLPENRVMTFLVPVLLDDPNEAFAWEAFVDYDPYTNPKPCASEKVEPTPGTLDGGTLVVPFQLAFNDGNPPCNLQAPSCHRIEFIVAYSFSQFHVPDSIGGDSVVWLYNGSGDTSACLAYDASAFGEGGLPMQDAASDHLPVVPESGSDP